MSSPDCKRQKLADDVNSVANMSNLSVISINAQRFKQVAKLDGFVDRTMLIEELLQGKKGEEDTCVMIFAPSKFGKTINLGMIRLFCEIEDKNTKTKEDVAKDPTMEDLRSNPSKNMKVFLRQFGDKKYEECSILKREQFVIQHFGRHPVILFDFKDCGGENKKEAILFCAKQVREAYLEHEYLENSKEFQSDVSKHLKLLKQISTDWINYSDVDLKSLSVNDVMDGLQNLIKSLRIHWGRLPVFLVDEVDKPCVAAMERELSEEEVREIGTIITQVICSILKAGDEQLKLQAALLTGICNVVTCGMAPMDNTLPVYFLSDDRFSKYYGLTTEEVDTLVKRLYGSQGDAERAKIISDINERYNGYYQRSSCGENKENARYCIFSVLNYLENTNTIKLCFWTSGGFLTGRFLPVLEKSVEIMNALHILFYTDSGTIEIEYQKAVNVQHILGLFRREIDVDPNAVFNFFLQIGYLTHSVEKPIENVGLGVKINVRIPNLEIKSIYKNMFDLYYWSLQEDIKLKLTSCGEIFKSLPTLDSTEFRRNDLDKLCKHLKCIFKFMQCKSERTICSHILAILKHHVKYVEGETEYAVKYFDDNGKQCVWGRRGNFAIIIEVKFNSDATGEPGNIGCKTKSSLAAAEDIIKLLSGKEKPEDGSGGKAGTGRDLLEVLNSQIKNYVLIGMAVDSDYTTHMLVFQDTNEWKNVIQVNPEKHVAEGISTHLKSEESVV